MLVQRDLQKPQTTLMGKPAIFVHAICKYLSPPSNHEISHVHFLNIKTCITPSKTMYTILQNIFSLFYMITIMQQTSKRTPKKLNKKHGSTKKTNYSHVLLRYIIQWKIDKRKSKYYFLLYIYTF
ncbi:hypothetical protein ACJX0J_009252 [Zea mays]